MPLRQIEVCARGLDRRCLLMQLRRELLGILNGAPAVLRQRLEARGLLLCEHERCLRLIQLCLAGTDLCLLNSHLRVDVLHARLGLLHRRLGLTDGDREVGRIDRHQEITLMNVAVVDNRQLDDAPRDLRSHRDDISAHGGVARPRRPHIVVPRRPAEQPGERDRRQRDQDWHHPYAAPGVTAGLQGRICRVSMRLQWRS